MSSGLTQEHVDNLEQALVSGELQVRIGDRWITYRSVEELKDALTYAKKQVAAASGSSSRTTAYTVGVDRGLG